MRSTPTERATASFAHTATFSGAITLNVEDPSSTPTAEEVRTLVSDRVCRFASAGSCTVSVSVQTAGGRRLDAAGARSQARLPAPRSVVAAREASRRHLSASGTQLVILVTRDLFMAPYPPSPAPLPPPMPPPGQGVAESYSYTDPLQVELRATYAYERDFVSDGIPLTYGTDSSFPDEPVRTEAATASVNGQAQPAMQSLAKEAVAAVPGTAMVSSNLETVGVRGFMSALGSDQSNVEYEGGNIQLGVAGGIGLGVEDVALKTLDVLHPPHPPPSPPPSPLEPPSPPLIPPGYPLWPPRPPSDLWYEPYFEDEGCDPDCFGGCRRSLWSSVFTWHGQGIALGASEDDAYVWPGFKSNVTIKRCHHVILDIDMPNVQLFSLVVWGTLEVQSRPGALVNLRAACVAIKCANYTAGYCGTTVARTPPEEPPWAG